MKKIIFLFILILVLGIVSGCGISSNATKNSIPNTKVTIFKSSTCGCCSNYVSYLKGKNFKVDVVNAEDLSSIKYKYGIPGEMESCHTMIIGDYFVEGHVPIEAINKLLEEKPQIKGIALPGMPSASPGMPGSKLGQFGIYSILLDGTKSSFMMI